MLILFSYRSYNLIKHIFKVNIIKSIRKCKYHYYNIM